jgi:non-ribosomal peptide synthetase component F
VLEAQLAYWRKQLAGLSPLMLPTDHPRSVAQTYQGVIPSLRLSAALRKELIAVSRQEDVTLFMLLLAAFQVLLMCYTGQTDICVGTPIANRIRAELEGLIGFFVNTLVLRTDLSGDPTFREILKRVRKVCLDAYTHQDLPFELLVETLRPKRQQSNSPLFQVMFMLRNIPTLPDFGGLALSPVILERGAAKFDLKLEVIDTTKELIVMVEYKAALFYQETIHRMMHGYKGILEKIVENPDSQVQLSGLEEEQTHLIDSFNEDLEDY